MPSKFPKVFTKRKSSGDVLEDVRPVSSFRVLERPSEPTNTFDNKSAKGLRRPTAEFRPASEGTDAAVGRAGVQNRGSGGTQRSGSSYGAYNTSSSDRYSSSSTLPSAASIEGDDFSHPHAHPRSSKTMPAGGGDSPGGFLKNAGRKFSFGGKKSLQAAEAIRANDPPSTLERPLYSGIHDLHIDHDLPAVPPIGRARATTETSYGSDHTVTPGRGALDKLELNDADDDDDGFGDIFAGIGEEKRRSQQLLTQSPNVGRPLTEQKNNAYKPYRPESTMPAPLQATRPFDNHPAMESATSSDGLMIASPVEESRGVFEMGIASPIDGRTAQQHLPQSPASPNSPTRQNRANRRSRTNSKALLPRRETSDYFEETDALFVGSSTGWKTSPQAERAPPTSQGDSSPVAYSARPEAENLPSEPAANPWAEDKPPPPPKHNTVSVSLPEVAVPSPTTPHDDVDQALLNDVSFQALAISADRLQQRAPSPPRVKPAGKVMTPAQFEKYRREQAQRRLAANDLSDSDDSKSDNEEEEEEDDQERNKRLAKQRQRQEAQMSVFRQSMMKTTGEAPLAPLQSGLRPPMDRNSSRLSSKPSLSNLKLPPSPSEEGEDDDVPLGILAAHGFPSKEHNRPPNHERSSSGVQYSSETYPPPGQSTAGGPAGPGGSLPAFARKLPQDPFFGASLVNQTDRQSFALGGGDRVERGSVYGGSQVGGSQAGSHLPPPGGLVGVIASEERARAIRRGSPAKTFGFGAQDPNGSMPLPPGVGGQPMMPQPPMPSPQPSMESQASTQMAQQMTQMMQMQMQWMQQMMAMQTQGMQMTPQMQQMQQMQQQMMMGMGQGMQGGMPGMQGMQMPGQMQGQQSGRSSTMLGAPNMHPNLTTPNQNGRAMSMMGGSRAPSVMMGSMGGMGGMGPQPGYTPSIAPSERTNIGQPSRYRPVSTVPAEAQTRSRTQSFSSRSNFGGFGNSNNRSSTMLARPTTSSGPLGSGKGQINVRLVETQPDEDEDEAGWEEMRKKKESKKSLWRLRKSGGGREKENISPSMPQGSFGKASSPMKQPEGLEGLFVPNVDGI